MNRFTRNRARPTDPEGNTKLKVIRKNLLLAHGFCAADAEIAARKMEEKDLQEWHAAQEEMGIKEGQTGNQPVSLLKKLEEKQGNQPDMSGLTENQKLWLELGYTLQEARQMIDDHREARSDVRFTMQSFSTYQRYTNKRDRSIFGRAYTDCREDD